MKTPSLSPAFTLKIKVPALKEGERIPEKFAFCASDGKGATKEGGNINPEISWSGAPEGTKSFALIIVDPNVPVDFTDANQNGKTLPKHIKRQDFYHLVLADIPVNITTIPEGALSIGVQEGGKKLGKTPYGIQGQNDYAKFYKGDYAGYDGPCPPWNDEQLHHYHHIIYALNIETTGLSGAFTGAQLQQAIEKNILARAEFIGTYSTNPALK